MTEFSEGDLIEATLGDTVIRGRVVEVGAAGDRVRIKGIDTYFPNSALGFTVEVIEKAAPALPTEVGFYLNRYGQLWTFEKNGWWRDDHDAYRSDDAAREVEPFTRLEPVADTAKRVLDAVREEILHCDRKQYDGLSTRGHLRELIQGIAAEFGVTS